MDIASFLGFQAKKVGDQCSRERVDVHVNASADESNDVIRAFKKLNT